MTKPWFKCSDQMPEPGVVVLTYGPLINGDGAGYEVGSLDRFGWGPGEYVSPTHWQEISSPAEPKATPKHNLCRCGRCPPESCGPDPDPMF